MKKRGKKRAVEAAEEEAKGGEKVGKFEGDPGKWKTVDTLMIGEFDAIPSDKIISFDLDSTLIKTKSGAVFPKNKDDWVLWHESVPKKLKEYCDKGYRVVIFTNQGGIGSGKIKPADFQYKVASIRSSLNVPLAVLVASEEDQYRKPATAMWKYFEDNLNTGIKIDLSTSYFVGDAAGRPAQGKRKKDFSDSDIKFALNVGVKFQTPEEFFLEEKSEQEEEVKFGGFNPSLVPTSGAVFIGDYEWRKIPRDEQEVVIFVGPPASGKSTFWENYLKEYVRVNRDTLKTKEKCIEKMKEALSEGKSCVIDNTNPTKEDRKIFIDVAKEYKMPLRCFWFNIDKPLALHLDNQRKLNTERVHLSSHVGKMPIHIFFKKFEKPEIEEGFTEIKEVVFIAKFVNEKDEAAFKILA